MAAFGMHVHDAAGYQNPTEPTGEKSSSEIGIGAGLFREPSNARGGKFCGYGNTRFKRAL